MQSKDPLLRGRLIWLTQEFHDSLCFERIPIKVRGGTTGTGSFDCVGVRFADANFAQDDKH